MAKSNKWEFSDKEIQRQIVAARKRDEIESPKEAAAVTAKIDKNGFIHLSFKDGFALTFPGSYIKELRTAKASEIVDLRLSPDGKAIYWPELDAHYTISGLLAGRFGNEAWMSELGKLGGTKTSVAKTIAARINGSKGGRPPI